MKIKTEEIEAAAPSKPKPNLLQRSLLLGAIAMFTVAGCAGLIALRQRRMTNKHVTVSAVAHIIDTYERRTGSTGQSAEVQDVIVDYEYTVNGRQYRDNVKLSGKTGQLFRKDQDAMVCYDPDDPADAELYASDYSCGG